MEKLRVLGRFYLLLILSFSSILKAEASKELSLLEPPMDEFIDSLMKRMTLEEKLGQLAQYAGGGSLGFNTRIDDDKKEMIRKGKVGSFLHVL
jgi:beta-glucosidase